MGKWKKNEVLLNFPLGDGAGIPLLSEEGEGAE